MIGMVLELPFPPTLNSYYKCNRKGGKRVSEEGLDYRIKIHNAIRNEVITEPLSDRLHVTVVLNMPDNRRRDLDNYMKALLDACTESGLWEDDSLIDNLEIKRGDVISPMGSVMMFITNP